MGAKHCIERNNSFANYNGNFNSQNSYESDAPNHVS
jgi:hypothetical protein